MLSKNLVITSVKSFIDFVQGLDGDNNIGIIYYCGHGSANLAGSSYIIPGDFDGHLQDTTMEYLTDRLINIDTISHLIIDAQMAKIPNRSVFIILADCCNDKASSKWYSGMDFKLSGNGGSVTYDSFALRHLNENNTDLRATAEARIDSAGQWVVPPLIPGEPVTNEFGRIPELIRAMTMNSYGNRIYFSAPPGQTIDMLPSPDLTATQQVGPICRRTIMYFQKTSQRTLQSFLEALTSKEFDPMSNPIMLGTDR